MCNGKHRCIYGAELSSFPLQSLGAEKSVILASQLAFLCDISCLHAADGSQRSSPSHRPSEVGLGRSKSKTSQSHSQLTHTLPRLTCPIPDEQFLQLTEEETPLSTSLIRRGWHESVCGFVFRADEWFLPFYHIVTVGTLRTYRMRLALTSALISDASVTFDLTADDLLSVSCFQATPLYLCYSTIQLMAIYFCFAPLKTVLRDLYSATFKTSSTSSCSSICSFTLSLI